MIIVHCDKCGRTWLSELMPPTACPKCHNATKRNARFYSFGIPKDAPPSIEAIEFQIQTMVVPKKEEKQPE